MKEPLVSIIVVTYNSSKFVVETLDSVYKQTYKNLELIITDDFSQDDTNEIVDEWINNHSSRFLNCSHIRTGMNTGISKNNNRGFKECKGEWIKYIAGDDILLPTSIQDYIFSAQNNTDHLWYLGKMKYYDEFFEDDRRLVDYENRIYACWEDHNRKTLGQLRYEIALNNFMPAPSMFYNSKIIQQVNGFDEKYSLCEDYPMNMKLLDAGYSPFFLDSYTIGYRTRAGSISSNKGKSFYNYPFLDTLYKIKKEYCFKYLSIRERIAVVLKYYIEKGTKYLPYGKILAQFR